jgi:hypothetical protein
MPVARSIAAASMGLNAALLWLCIVMSGKAKTAIPRTVRAMPTSIFRVTSIGFVPPDRLVGTRRCSQARPKRFSSFKETFAQELDKGAAGDPIGILAAVGVLKRQIAGDGQELSERCVGNLTVGPWFHSLQTKFEVAIARAVYFIFRG